MPTLSPRWQRYWIMTRFALIALASLGLYGIVVRPVLFKQSVAPYYINLADALLHGRVDLVDPEPDYDLIRFDGKWYVAHQPLPSVVMLPFVLLQGKEHASDIAVSVLISGFSIALCDVVLRLVAPDVNGIKRGALVAFFGFGTPQMYMGGLGTVWFMGQTMATLLMWGFIWAVVCRRAGWAGIALGLVALTRLSIVPGAMVFALGWWWLLPEASRSAWLQQALRFLIPIVLAGGILAGYNGVRFGNIFDNGYDYLNDSESIQKRRLEHGTFSPAFFLENLYVATIKPARSVRLDCLGGATRLDNCGWLSPDPIGMGLLWTCPLLLLGWWAGNTRQTWLIALAIGLVMLPALLYHNTGSMQFGYRFIVDALPLWMILLAWSARRIPLAIIAPLVLYSAFLHLWATRWLHTLIFLNRFTDTL